MILKHGYNSTLAAHQAYMWQLLELQSVLIHVWCDSADLRCLVKMCNRLQGLLHHSLILRLVLRKCKLMAVDLMLSC
jgi:hypothetical protein